MSKVVCPKCKHQFESGYKKQGRRRCAKCKKSIAHHHKWFFREDGRIEHRHCNRPNEYK